ncbi:MAG: 1-(5-phosphoribosyl)-5-[Oscillospiraceae bacterium]|nr:1-(5-phosphoribosyl)-5-[(5-phosphoribosylamino)methylideneamino]imidazole-4-carboxamide isomerase [Oscillospiraceae bacterium]
MIILPAIDLVGGKCVRLFKGDYANMTVYSDDPAAMAASFEARGAQWLHCVDLEGARDGGTPNFDYVKAAIDATSLRVEIGGGVRDMRVVERYLSAGVARVILGTAAVSDKEFLRDAVREFGEKIAVGADLRDGFVAIKGWRETTAATGDSLASELMDIGVKTLICTDISRDGAMRGTNRALYRALSAKYSMDIIASGGVSTLEDVRAVKDAGAAGAIIGKAIYTGDIDLREAIEVSK